MCRNSRPGARSTAPSPGRTCPTALGVILGAQVVWSPEREGQAPGRCGECGNAFPRRSRPVCAGCLASGYDDQIKGLLTITPPNRARGRRSLGEVRFEVEIVRHRVRDAHSLCFPTLVNLIAVSWRARFPGDLRGLKPAGAARSPGLTACL